MTTIVTRAGKGSPLTHNEVDTNFTNLNTAKLEAGAIALGSAAAPSISFVSDTNTGIFSPGADQVAISTSGVARLTTSTTAVSSSLAIDHPLGAVGTPSITFTGDLNTGIFSPAADTLAFVEGGSEAARIDSSGRLLVGTSSANANGGILQLSSGITFPATQVAAADANTLDDYEEGTWTPGVGGTATYINQEGKYTKIGNMVYFSVFLRINVQGTGTSSSISGLPFTSTTTVTGMAVITYFVNFAVNVITPTLEVNQNGTTLTSYSRTTAGATAAEVNILGDNTSIYFTGMYRV